MTRTTMRWTMAGALALAAAGATGGAHAAPSSSPFAGAYAGTGPESEFLTWQIDISSRGSVSGATSFKFFGVTTRGKLSGTVTDDGEFSYRVDFNTSGHPKGGFFAESGKDGAEPILADGPTTTFGTATLVKNADGSVTSTSSSGIPILWTPR